jgi:TPR repeat protein
MRYIRTIFFIGAILSLVGCSNRVGVVSTNASSFLTGAQVTNLTQKAQFGDRDAAFKLYLFYNEIKLDRDTSLKWLTKAAECGDAGAQYEIGLAYDGEFYPDLIDMAKAKYWFRRAADNGNIDAKSKLAELQMENANGK